jgi:cbb3-type cytochrome oxidase subunit 3
MFQQLSAATGAQLWAIASMFLFIGVFLVVSVRVLSKSKDHFDHQARLPLDDDVSTRAASSAPRPTAPAGRGR